MPKLISITLFFLSIYTVSFAQDDPWASIEDFDDTQKSSNTVSSNQLSSKAISSQEPLLSSSIESSSNSQKSSTPKSSTPKMSSINNPSSSTPPQVISSSEQLNSSSFIIISSETNMSSVSSDSITWKAKKTPPKFKIIVETEDEDDGEDIVFDKTESQFGQGPSNLQIKTRSTVKNIDDYRSPKAAFFSSLILPGAGQAYVATGQGGWLRASAWFITEAALWTGLYTLGWKAEDKALQNQDEAYKKWNFQNYETFISDSLKQAKANKTEEAFTEEFLSTRFDYCRSIHNQEDLRDVCENFEPRYTEHLTLIQNSSFEINEKAQLYRIITYKDYNSGWSDGGQNQLSNAIDDEERAREMTTLFLTGIVFNHVLSAIDAAWMAYSGNKALYQKSGKPSITGIQGYLRPDMQGRIQWNLSLAGEF
ncbi:hypothetical protein OAA91_02015 [Fibrobacterales bacterium]|nr:hypothetical protein [Fibrobacterales bacterium]